MPSPLPLLLIVCTGNVCRSPMGEALFLHHLPGSGMKAQVLSRGLAAPVGRPPHPFALDTAQEHGVPIDPAKRAAAITLPELTAATVIFVMDSGHRQEILQRYPTASGKTFLLGQWQSSDISDPINQPRQAFETAWQAIDAGTQSWLAHLRQSGLLPTGSPP